MTRLLRACHQVHDEALCVLYSHLTFCWPLYTDYRLVRTVLDPLRPVARAHIRRINLCVVLHGVQAPKLCAPFDQWKGAFVRIAVSLPSLIDVTVTLGWMSGMVPVSCVTLVVERGLNLLSPLRKVEKLKVTYRDVTSVGDTISTQRMAIGAELQRRVEGGQWAVNKEDEPSEP